MRNYDDISRKTIKIEINHTLKTIVVKEVGEKIPVSMSFDVSIAALAGSYRDAAEYLLDLAAQLQGTTIKEQAEMLIKRFSSRWDVQMYG